ncbi:MAG: MFS transporter [Actinobacteria bacterium]|nr:MFS transporter [Actinomycetota bacterium]
MSRPPAQHRRPRAAWGRAAFALFAVAAGTNVPTPLLLLYRDELHLTGPASTVIFGVYAAGLAPSLLGAGPLSDRYGRRPLVLPFTLLAGLASLLFLLAADSFPLLLVARFVQGLVSGAVFTAASAWLAELSAAEGQPQAAGRRSAVALAGGFSLGPLVSSVLAVTLPGPLALPYLAHAALAVAGFLIVLRLPETAPRRRRQAGDPARAPLVRRGDRLLALTALAPVAVCVYGFPATVIAGLPVLIDLPGNGVLATGVLAGLTLGAGAVVAPLQRRLGTWTAVAAATSGTAGFVLCVTAAATDLWPVLIPAGLLLGAGSGWSLASGLALTGRLSAPERRGTLTGIFYTVAYLGFAAPFLVTSAARTHGSVAPLVAVTVATAVLAARLVPAARAGRI